jgi:hypothetical protein
MTMTNFELPQQDISAPEGEVPQDQREVEGGDDNLFDVADLISLEWGGVPPVASKDPKTGAFVIDAQRFNAMTPQGSFDLAGVMVNDVASTRNERQDQANQSEIDVAFAENQAEAEKIRAEIAAENAILAQKSAEFEEKYGAPENWPMEAREAFDRAAHQSKVHQLGTGFALGVAGIGALAGFSGNAEAGGPSIGEVLVNTIGGPLLGRTERGIAIEQGNRAREMVNENNYQIAVENLEIKIAQARLKLQSAIDQKTEAHNAKWDNLIRAGKATQADEEAAWGRFEQEGMRRYEELDQRAELARAKLTLKYEARERTNAVNRSIAHSNANARSINQGIQTGGQYIRRAF